MHLIECGIFHFFCCFEIWVGGPLILDLAWERLSRSLLTTFGFWLEFMKTIFLTFFDFFFTWTPGIYYTLKLICIQFRYWIKCGSGHFAQFWLLFVSDSSLGNPIFLVSFLPSFPGIYLKLELVWKNGLDWVWTRLSVEFFVLFVVSNFGWADLWS